MRFDLITIFPEFFAGPLEHGLCAAREAGLIDVRVQDLREFTKTGIARWTIVRLAAARDGDEAGTSV